MDGYAQDAPRGPDGGVQTDATLMRQLIEGSQDALGSLYDRHVQAVFAAAVRVTRDRGIAADVVQETFLTLWNRAELFDPSRGSVSAWLVTVARNRAIDRLRAAARHDRAATFSSFTRGDADDQSTLEWLTSTGDLVGAAGAELGPEAALADKETRELIQDAVTSLAPLERRVIELAYGTGLSQSEIAAHLDWPIGTVKTRTRRALRHIRERLEGPEADGETPGSVPLAAGSGASAWQATADAMGRVRVARPCLSPC
ncbi:MAG TPA: sigma-70 family RNA polymerase sigma factor [Candidatus Limnocylindrales bacterium]|nr:sigma-70 family RNA polymerase sigma factor [Candidatus Limnocylindrales bacterium]